MKTCFPHKGSRGLSSTNTQNLYDLHVSRDALKSGFYLAVCRSIRSSGCSSEGKQAHGCQWMSMPETCSSRERFQRFPNRKIRNAVAIENGPQYPPASTVPLPAMKALGSALLKKTDGVEGIQIPQALISTGHMDSVTYEHSKPGMKNHKICPELTQAIPASPSCPSQPRSPGRAKGTEFIQPCLTQTQTPASAEMFTDGCIGCEGKDFGKILLALKDPRKSRKILNSTLPQLIKPSLFSSVGPKIKARC